MSAEVPQGGLARDRRHDPRPHRPHRRGQGGARLLRDPARRPRRPADRPEADPGRLEAARGHRDLPRGRRERALRRRRHFDRPDPADAEAAAREARPRRRADRDLPVRSPGHPVRPDRPPRARHARGLAERGFRTTITSLKCGHGFYTTSGNVSHHSSGNAVDIAMVNGIPILGHQEPGGSPTRRSTCCSRCRARWRPTRSFP